MSDENEPQKLSRKEKGIAMILLGTLAVIFAPYLLTRNSCFPSFADANTGAIGDTIGGITAPIVGILGAILVFYALLEQINANKIISDQFLEQKKITHRQNFEQTFFNMLNIQHEIVNNIECMPHDLHLNVDRDVNELEISTELKEKIVLFNSVYTLDFDEKGKPYKGRAFFSYTLDALLEGTYIADSIGGFKTDSESTLYTNLKTKETFKSYFPEVYKILFRQLDTHLGHYYRNLYRIIKMIDEQKFSDDDRENYEIKYFYTSIVRSQLSDYEIEWLFFNGLFDYGKKFKPLIQEYTLLKILDGNTDETIVKYKNAYAETAFKKVKWVETNEVKKVVKKQEPKNYVRKAGHERTVKS